MTAHTELIYIDQPCQACILLMQLHRSSGRSHLDQLVAARLARQSILDKPEPPELLTVFDEAVLHRLAVEGITIYRSDLVRKSAVTFERIRGEALPRSASRDLILKVPEKRWNG